MTRTVVISGGTGGLGSAVTARLAADGWRVVVPWVVESELDRVRGVDGIELIQADLMDPDSVATVVDLATADGSELRSLVNLVGGFAMGGRLHETPVDDFESLLRLNVRPLYLLSQAVLPHLVAGGGGAIVGVSAKAAFAPFSGASAYVTAKAAVWTLIQSIAVEYAKDGVRANAILPSVIDTPGNRDSQPSADRSNWVSPAQIAEAIAFLVSDAGSAVTGAQVPVPGVG